jgi:hypothetical protein
MATEDVEAALMLASDYDIQEEFVTRGLQYELNNCDMVSMLEAQGFTVIEPYNTGGVGYLAVVYKIFEKFRRGENIDNELRSFFYDYLGRIA